MAAYPQFIVGLSFQYQGGQAFAQFDRDMGRAGSTARASGRRLERDIGGPAAVVSDRFRALGLAAQTAQGPFSTLGTRFNAISRSLSELGASLGGTLAALAGGGAIIAATTQFQNYQALLRSTVETERDYQRALRATFEISRNSRSSLEGTTRLYARLNPILKEAGVGFREIGSIVETANKSIVLSGSSAQEATAAMIQFSQALSAGVLSGDEFRSLGENANFLRRAIAQGIQRGNLIEGFDGTLGALKKLADEQKLTTDIVVQALRIMEGEVNARFARMPLTISQAATQIQTSVLGLVSSFESSTGGLTKIAQSMAFLANNMNLVVAAAAPLAARFLGIPALLAAAAGGMRALGVAMGVATASATAQGLALARLGISTQVMAANVLRLSTAQATGSAAAIAWARAQNLAVGSAAALGAGLRGLVAIMGGPLGVAVSAAVAGFTLLALRKSDTARAAEQLGVRESSLAERIDVVSQALVRQNGLLAENEAKKRATVTNDAARAVRSSRGQFAQEIAGLTPFGGDRAITGRFFSELSGQVNAGQQSPEQAFAALVRFNRASGNRFNLDGVQAAAARAAAVEDEYRRTVGAPTRYDTGSDGNFRGRDAGKAKPRTASEIEREARRAADAENALTQQQRLRARLAEQIAAIQKGGGTEDDKIRQIRDATSAYNDQLQSLKDQAEAQRESARAQREGETAQRRAAAEAKRLAREQESLEKANDRLALSAREAAEGWAALTEVQRIAERAGDALRVVDNAERAGAIDNLEAIIRRGQITQGRDAQIRQPIRDIEDALDIERQVIAELLAGRETEAEIIRIRNDLLRQGREITDKEVDGIRARLEDVRRENLLLNQRNQLVDIYVRSAGRVQGALTGGIRGLLDGNLGSVGDTGKELASIFKDALAEQLSLSLFGDQEAAMRERLNNQFGGHVREFGDAVAQLSGAATGSTTGAVNPERPLAGIAAAAGSVFGPTGGIIGSLVGLIAKPLERVGIVQERAAKVQESAAKQQQQSMPANPTEAFNRIGENIARTLGLSSDSALGRLAGSLGTGLQAYAEASAFTNLLGIKGKAAGAIKGGYTGAKVGMQAAGPYGAIAGAVIGGTIGVIGVTPRGYTNLAVGQDGMVSTSDGGARGKGKDASKDASRQLASTISDVLSNAVQSLGGTLSLGASLGTIGPSGNKFLFSPDQARNGSVKTNVQKFDTAEEAVNAALRSAIDRGVIQGIRASTTRLLRAGQDFTRQLEKATRFEDVFRRLRQFVDPAGAALEALNREFESLKLIFDEAGASAAEYADLQKLYDLEREQALRESQSRISQALRSLLDDLKIGDNGLSLRDRRANALTEFNRFSTDSAVSADPEGFADAARALLDIERELFGSQTAYFDRFNEIVERAERILGEDAAKALPPAFSVGNKAIETKPITDGLGVLGDRMVGAIDDLGEMMQRYWSGGGGYLGGGRDYFNLGYVAAF